LDTLDADGHPRARPGPLPTPVVGMRVELRKNHPCGSRTFTVIALGADIRLTCDGCGTKIFIDRARFAARVRGLVGG
jgi:hypothetical protein